MKKLFPALFICFIFQIIVSPPLHASCQGGSCGSTRPECVGVNPMAEVFDPVGSSHVRFDNLIGPEVIQYDTAVPFYKYTYYRYLTPCGNIVIMPALFTTLFSIFDPSAMPPGGAQGTEKIFAAVATALQNAPGGAEAQAQVDETMEACGYESESEFYNDVVNGSGCAWTFDFNGTMQLLYFLLGVEPDADNPWSIVPGAVLVYPGDQCTTLEDFGGCPPCPQSGPANCPPATIETLPIEATTYMSAPANAVVVGQDPNRRGADILAEVTVPPIKYTWYESIPVYADRCVPVGRTGRAANCKVNSSSWWNDGFSERYIDHYDCIQHIEILEDPVVSMIVTANLAAKSGTWITDDLGNKWYYAHIFTPFWMIIPTRAAPQMYCDGDKTCHGLGEALRVPFRDPGYYELIFSGVTQGTKVTAPRFWKASGSFVVNVILVQETGPM